MLQVNKEKCPQNHHCVCIEECPVYAISQVGHKVPDVEIKKCIQCGKCVKYCPLGVFQIVKDD